MMGCHMYRMSGPKVQSDGSQLRVDARALSLISRRACQGPAAELALVPAW